MSSAWIFEIELFLPMVQTAIGANGGLPDRLEYKSIFLDGASINVNDIAFSLRRWASDKKSNAPQIDFPHLYESVILKVEVSGKTEDDVTRLLQENIESVLERLEFLVQFPVGLGTLEQINPDGSKRTYSNCQRFVQPDRRPINYGLEMGAESEWLSLDICNDFSDVNLNRAMHWCAKAIAEREVLDRFISLWVSLEILCNREGVKVKKPYTAQCGCLIKDCPSCGKSTEKAVNGDSIKLFLESFGVQSETSKKMWSLRQVVHGQKIAQSIMQDASGLTQILYGVVSLALKKSFNLADTDRPLPPRNVMFGGGSFVRVGP